jgi:hypothetical protein
MKVEVCISIIEAAVEVLIVEVLVSSQSHGAQDKLQLLEAHSCRRLSILMPSESR